MIKGHIVIYLLQKFNLNICLNEYIYLNYFNGFAFDNNYNTFA